MSIFDDARQDFKALLRTDDFGRAARYNGTEIVLIRTKEFNLVPFEVASIGTYSYVAYGSADDLEGIESGDEIEIENDDGEYETYGVEGVHGDEAGRVALLITMK